MRGGLYDRRTGLERFGVRDYDPGTGRWIEPDPILFAGGGTNLYAYVGNNPISYTDLLGLSPDCSTYWDRYMDFVSDYAINVGPCRYRVARRPVA